MHEATKDITQLILDAKEKARKETASEPDPVVSKTVRWPIDCTVGPGLEGVVGVVVDGVDAVLGDLPGVGAVGAPPLVGPPEPGDTTEGCG